MIEFSEIHFGGHSQSFGRDSVTDFYIKTRFPIGKQLVRGQYIKLTLLTDLSPELTSFKLFLNKQHKIQDIVGTKITISPPSSFKIPLGSSYSIKGYITPV